MGKIRISGIIIVLFGIGIYLIFENEITKIAMAITIGLGIGVVLTGRYGRS